MAALLEREAAAQPDPGARAEILRRVAQIHREKLGNAGARDRDLQGDPARRPARTRCRCALVVEIYEREGDFVSLAQLLREQIEARPSRSRSASACCAGCW